MSSSALGPASGLLGLALLAAVSGCASDSATDEDVTLTVYAAASLAEAFEDIGAAFEADHDDVEVELNFGGSSDLVTQIVEGAPADVFASADDANMDKLLDAGLHGRQPQDFAANTLEIVTPPDNPAGIEEFRDLAGDGVNLVVCAPEVPCGSAAVRAAEIAGVTLHPVSEEQSVTDVLAKVRSGEADAGLVYRTDVAAAGDAVLGIGFPESAEVVNAYPITTIEDSDHSALAGEFVDLVLSDTGQSIMAEAGFAPAPSR